MMTTRFVICATVTAVSAFVSLGFSVAAVRVSSFQTRSLALYACARSAAFAILSIVPFVSGSTQWLYAVTVGMIVVQAIDAGIGITIKDRMKTFGPASVAITNLVGLIALATG